MAGHVAVHCRLPHGLILSHPMDHNQRVELKGKNKAAIIGSPYGTTMVSADFWEQWIAANAEFAAVKSGAIFVAKSDADAKAIAKEYEKRKTGFEGMPQESLGVKKATEKDDE